MRCFFIILFLTVRLFSKVIVVEYEYTIGDRESKQEGEKISFHLAKKEAVERVSTFIESNTLVKNYQVVEDKLKAFSYGIIKNIDVLEKDFRYPVWKIKISVEIDETQFFKELENFKVQEKKQFEIYKQNEEILKELKRLKEEIEEVKDNDNLEKLKKEKQEKLEVFSVEELFRKGLNAQQEKDYEKAKEFYIKSIESDNLDMYKVYTYNNLGLIYEMESDYTKAIRVLLKSIKMNPEFPDPYLTLGVIYHNQKRYTEAAKYYNEAIKVKSDFHLGYYNLGLLYYSKKDYNNALKAFEQAVVIDPTDHNSHFYTAFIYYKTGYYDIAVDSYKKVIDYNPNNLSAHFNIAIIYDFKMSDIWDKLALKHYKKYLLLKGPREKEVIKFIEDIEK